MSGRGNDAAPMGARSFVVPATRTGWVGVPPRPYKDQATTHRHVTRHNLAAPADAAFELRYFEVGPDGFTSFEQHEHVHVVYCVRGRGTVRLAGELQAIGPGNVVYVAPTTPHQFRNAANEPFGFLCIVNRDRDRPVALTEDGNALTR